MAEDRNGPGSLIVGDIGGTHGRFALAGRGLKPEKIDIQDGDDHEAFADALGAYLDGLDEKPKRAAFAVAGPVTEGRFAIITNRRNWEIDADALEQRFGLERVEVMNDFVAQAASLPHLDADDVTTIGPAAPLSDAAKVAVGPGTGLGVAALIPDRGDWRPIESEGGHIEFASVDPREAAAFDIVRRDLGRVSAEYIVSGPGLARLYSALAELDGHSSEGWDPPRIVEAAKSGDGFAHGVAAMFLVMLARFAGDMAVTFGARGGAYLCGGVAPRLVEVLDETAFRAAFEAKEPHRAMMEKTATLLVTSPVAGLVGCAAEALRRGRNAEAFQNSK